MGPMTVTIKRFLPKSLLGRSLLIIVMPLVILQVVSATIFYETHWDKVTLRLARGVAGDIAAIITLLKRNPESENRGWYRNSKLTWLPTSEVMTPTEKHRGLTHSYLKGVVSPSVKR